MLKPKSLFQVVTLCGSTRIGKEFWGEVAHNLSLMGYIVLKVDVWGLWEEMHNGSKKAEKEMLDAMHKRKIEMSDFVYVLNKNGYIGKSTTSEIEYAEKLGKIVIYMEPTGKDLANHITSKYS